METFLKMNEFLPFSLQEISKKKKLYTQGSVMSETPVNTPPQTQEIPMKTTKTKKRTKIIKKGSLIMAQPPEIAVKENIKPPEEDLRPPTRLPKVSQRKKPLLSQKKNLRRSSIDFVKTVKKPPKSILIQPKELVLTSCSLDDQDLALKATKLLPGKAKIGLHVKYSTTHVICGEERRTLNMLRAILRGCWILNKSWLLASIEANGWVDEEPYELVSFSSAVKARRIEREADFLQCDLLREIEAIYIGKHCKVPKKDLVDLIHLAGGQTVNQMKMASVILGHDLIEEDGQELIQVSEKWLLDSLQQFCPLPFVDYLTK